MVEFASKLSVYHNIVTRFFTFSFTLLLLLSGCTVTKPTPTKPPPAAPTPVDPVVRLLDLAASAFENQQLTTPFETSAYRYYLDVLSIDPDNPDGHLGISNIIEQYLSWALNHVHEGNYRQARQYVGRAQSIDETHPNIQPVLQSIRERENAVVTRFDLATSDVRNRKVSKMMLRHIAASIERNRAFVTIQAPDDASGRWLYRELNSRVDFRIEARFEFGSKPAILLSQ